MQRNRLLARLLCVVADVDTTKRQARPAETAWEVHLRAHSPVARAGPHRGDGQLRRRRGRDTDAFGEAAGDRRQNSQMSKAGSSLSRSTGYAVTIAARRFFAAWAS